MLAGRAFAAAGVRDRAVEEREKAAAELDACGARRFREEAMRELRRLGRRFHRPPKVAQHRAGIGSLTPPEREVTELVGHRKTNREIAAELFLSEKTVETHLHNMFEKLGVTSRAALARAVEAPASE